MQRVFSRASCGVVLSLLFGMAGPSHGEITNPFAMVDVIRSGQFEVLANTLVTEAPMIQFAYGAVKQAQAECGFVATPDSVTALAHNYAFFINFSHFSNVDEWGRPAPTRDGFIVVGRASRFNTRFLIAQGFQRIGAEWVTNAVKEWGCVNPALIAFVENADAMVALGKAPHIEGPLPTTTLINVLYRQGDAYAECHYHDGGDDEYTTMQYHYVIEPVNSTLILNQPRIEEIIESSGQMPFFRKACANNLDPDRPWRVGYPLVDPEDRIQIESDGSLPQNMAEYYLEEIVGRGLNADEQTEIFLEIEFFEKLDISSTEVTKSALEAKEGRSKRFPQEDPSKFPIEVFCFFRDNELRRELFFEEKGRAVRLDHMEHPLQEADYQDIIPNGAAYLSTTDIGRGEILIRFGRSWRWDGSACVQD